MIKRLAFAVCASMVLAAAPVWAQCGGCKEEGGACSMKEGEQCSMSQEGGAAKEAMCDSDVTCDGDVVRFEGTELPRIGFKVGEQITCCMKSAKEMTQGDASKIQYVVAGKTYKNLGEAKVARTAELEKFYQDVLAVKFAVGEKVVCCPTMAGELSKQDGKPIRYRLASAQFPDQASAEKTAKVARAAGDEVAMRYLVGQKSFTCPNEAGAVAKTDGASVEYCIGERKTACPTTAKMMLAEARIQAALVVMAKSTPKVF